MLPRRSGGCRAGVARRRGRRRRSARRRGGRASRRRAGPADRAPRRRGRRAWRTEPKARTVVRALSCHSTGNRRGVGAVSHRRSVRVRRRRRRCAPAAGGSSSRSMTSAVHPVWCDAPSPAPLSPWKYSKNSRLSHAGSFWKRAVPPKTGRWPSGPRRKIDVEPVGEVLRDLQERELRARAGRVLHGELGADVLVEPGERPDDEVVHRHPDRAPPVGVAAVHRSGRLGRFVVDGVADAVDGDARRAGRRSASTATAGRGARGTTPRRTARRASCAAGRA